MVDDLRPVYLDNCPGIPAHLLGTIDGRQSSLDPQKVALVDLFVELAKRRVRRAREEYERQTNQTIEVEPPEVGDSRSSDK